MPPGFRIFFLEANGIWCQFVACTYCTLARSLSFRLGQVSSSRSLSSQNDISWSFSLLLCCIIISVNKVMGLNFTADKERAKAMLLRCYLSKEAPQWRLDFTELPSFMFFFLSAFGGSYTYYLTRVHFISLVPKFHLLLYISHKKIILIQLWQEGAGGHAAKGYEIWDWSIIFQFTVIFIGVHPREDSWGKLHINSHTIS